MREVIRQVQTTRNSANLQVDDRIALVLETTSSDLAQAIHEHSETIKHEVLAGHLTKEGGGTYEQVVKVDGHELNIKLSKS
jgi:hypothetical protein